MTRATLRLVHPHLHPHFRPHLHLPAWLHTETCCDVRAGVLMGLVGLAIVHLAPLLALSVAAGVAAAGALVSVVCLPLLLVVSGCCARTDLKQHTSRSGPRRTGPS